MDQKKQNYIGIAYDWEYDKDFVDLIRSKAAALNYLTYLIDAKNLKSAIQAFKNGEICFDFYFDRASDTSREFLELNRLVQKAGILHLDPFDNQNWAQDKATMHLEFITNGINTPYSIIIPSYTDKKELFISVSDLAKLGRPFIIKPAYTSGGGIGVVQGAETLQDVLLARKEFEQDKYLLQEMVHPLIMDSKPGWFRGFFSCGLVQCTWWNPETHIYSIVTEDEIASNNLGELFAVVKKIAEICKLKFFSTEIALTEKRQFIVVDYVNITSDMRMQSIHHDGVPDTVVEKIADRIVMHINNAIEE
jgi:hypothetical protein